MNNPTDRALLELAAKAVGNGGYWNTYAKIFMRPNGNEVSHLPWNPLTDDGDALRLAAKLGMQIDMRDPETRIYAAGAGEVITEYHANLDALAATRRAIVRAAAAVAKGVAP